MIKIIYKLILEYLREKKVEKLLEINKYLNNYNYDIDTTKSNSVSNNNGYIWQLWFQDEANAPEIVQKCLKSIKNFHPEKKVIVLNENSIGKYIEVPDFIKNKYKKGIITKAHYSDYIRTCLLEKYGGIWIDSTVLLTDRISDKILNQRFFVFKNPIWFDYQKVPSEYLFKVFLTIYKESAFYGSSWFVVSKPHNLIIKIQKSLLEQYWKKENILMHYFLYHFFISKTLIKNIESKKIFEKMHSLSNKAPHFLQNIFNEKFDAELFNEIKQYTPIHKLTYKFKKVKSESFLEHILREDNL